MKNYGELHILHNSNGLGIIFREKDKKNHTGLRRAITTLSESAYDDLASYGYRIVPDKRSKPYRCQGRVVFLDSGGEDRKGVEWEYDEVCLLDFSNYKCLDKIEIDYWNSKEE